MRSRVLATIGLVTALMLAGGGHAVAVQSTAATKSTEASSNGGQKYDLSWTLPSAGKSGCLVCHGDKNLVRVREGKLVSMYVDYQTLQQSAHADLQCTACHTDFAYKAPHANAKTDAWRSIAKSSCKNCHKDAFAKYAAGAHSPARPPSEKARAASTSVDEGAKIPQCGDCHGGHDIPVLKDNPEAQRTFHASALEMCGQCHQALTDQYADYYHGAAYQDGAPDAPACWDCHRAHDVLPSDNRRSATNPDNLPETCGQCHKGDPDVNYTAYSTLIHGKASLVDENPVVVFYRQTGDFISGLWNRVREVFGGQ